MIKDSNNLLGNFIKTKRLSLNLSLRTLAKLLDKSPSYISSIENGNRYITNNPICLNTLADVLKLNSEEQIYLYDLASNHSNKLPADITDYIKQMPIIKQVIRTAIQYNATSLDWEKFIENISK